MAKPNYQYEKRQKDLAKQRKKQEKEQEKALRKAGKVGAPSADGGSEPEGASAGEDSSTPSTDQASI